MRIRLRPSRTGLIALDLTEKDTADSPPLAAGYRKFNAPEFRSLAPGRVTAASLACSLLSHGAGAAVLLLAAPYLAPDPLPAYAVRKVPIDSLELLLPVLQAPRPAPAPGQRSSPAPRERAQGRSGPSGSSGQAARPTFELPPLPVRPRAEVTLLQPPTDADVAIPQELRLPPIMQWSVAPKAKLPPKRFAMPGTVAVNRQIPHLDAPPKLEVPNAMSDVGAIKLAAAAEVARPALPVKPATTMPVRSFVMPQPSAPAPAALHMIDGDDLNLIAIGPPPIKALGSVKLPPGSQIAGIHSFPAPVLAATIGGAGSEGGRSAGAAAGPGAGEGANAPGAGAGAGAAAAKGTGAGAGAGAAAAKGTGGGRPGDGDGRSERAGTGSAGRTGTGDSGPNSAGPPGGGSGNSRVPGVDGGKGSQPGPGGSGGTGTELLAATVPIRIEHPETRTFDVVVVQSSAMPDAASAGILSGSPIYTVYLPVGTSRRWIMQYCVPKESAIQKREGIAIQLGNPAPVKAPYPRITVVPPRTGGERVVMHGFITELGAVQDLRVVSGAKVAEELMIVPFLQRWVFRPATRDGRPVSIEFVLVIPPELG